MKTGWKRTVAGIVAALALGPLAAPALAEIDADKLRAAKALFFDRKYAEARQAWQAIQTRGSGPEAESAPYWIARCSEGLGENERALKEYRDYIARRPSDRILAQEARTSRVGLAVKLYKAGLTPHLAVVKQALSDPDKTVSYYAALQLASLGCDVGREAFPVLRKVLAEEKDQDLVERAKLPFLRCDPKGLREIESRSHPGEAREATWIKVRIWEKGKAEPVVSVNVPVALADLVLKSLPDDARRELRRKGFEPENFWDKLKKLGPTEFIEINGDDGERIRIWME